ncbi:MAG: tripartite tricarboxylate transporter substrate-binding protein [Hyphomicrobium sp.]
MAWTRIGPTKAVPAAMLPVIGVLAIGAMGKASPAVAQDFYAGKTLTVVVGNTAGSGYDTYGRLLARHITKYVPGKPAVIVQNMPGAGSIKATDYTYSVAPKDGTLVTLAMPGALVEPLTGDPTKYRYDPVKIAYIGTMDSGTRMCMTRPGSSIKSMADARRTKTIMAATAAGSSAYDYPNFINALTGTQFTVVTGYPGPGDMFLAADRGEAEGLCGIEYSTYTALRPNWLAGEKKGNPLVQLGLEVNPRVTALGFPSIWEFIKPDDKALVELIVSQQVFQRPFLAPPGTPEPQIKALRTAFMAALKDPELLEEAKKSNIEINAKSGEEVEALVKKIYAAPKGLIERMAKVIRP